MSSEQEERIRARIAAHESSKARSAQYETHAEVLHDFSGAMSELLFFYVLNDELVSKYWGGGYMAVEDSARWDEAKEKARAATEKIDGLAEYLHPRFIEALSLARKRWKR